MENTDKPQFKINTVVGFLKNESDPEKNHFLFAYKISIQNTGEQAAQLLSRHWIITDSTGRVEEVKGPGVVGMQPKIEPGQTFEYESACPMMTSHGSMKGFYSFVSKDGESFKIPIPEFYLIAPQALH